MLSRALSLAQKCETQGDRNAILEVVCCVLFISLDPRTSLDDQTTDRAGGSNLILNGCLQEVRVLVYVMSLQ